MDYIAIDMSAGLASFVITKNPGNLYTEASYKRLIPHILYSVKYTGDMRYLNRFADDPLAVIDSIFRVVLPNNGYNIREEQIALAKKMYIGFTESRLLSVKRRSEQANSFLFGGSHCSQTPQRHYLQAEPARNHHHIEH